MSKLEIKIPPHYTALSILGSNKIIEDGDVFADDHFVYDRDGKKKRKWFSYREGWNHFWPPVLNDAARLEVLYQKLKHRSDLFWSRISEILQQIFATTEKVAHAMNRHGRLICYEVRYSNSFGCLSYSSNVVDSNTDTVNEELGARLYSLEFGESPRWLISIQNALNDSLISAIRKSSVPRPLHLGKEAMVTLFVNDRIYIYKIKPNPNKLGDADYQSKYCYVEKLLWPEDENYFIGL